MRYFKVEKCWMCERIKTTTEHHVVPKSLRKLVPKLEKAKVKICESCHAKIHILLPRFFGDGSYHWKGSSAYHTIKPEWKDWSEKEILEWD